MQLQPLVILAIELNIYPHLVNHKELKTKDTLKSNLKIFRLCIIQIFIFGVQIFVLFCILIFFIYFQCFKI